MGIIVDPIELLALKKLSLICRALGDSLSSETAKREQLALTSVLVEVCNRAAIDNERAKAAALSGERDG